MDQIKTGSLIRALRQKQGLTQRGLAERIGVSDKAVSKWERGCGTPDIALLPALSEALRVDTEALLKGDLGENSRSNGNLKKLQFFVCPQCGNLLFSTDGAEIRCCGKKLAPLQPRKADTAHALEISLNDGEWYVSSAHPMERGHHIAFIALLTGDTAVVRRLYPEWGLETRLPYFAHGLLLWYCTEDGLFYQAVTRK